jgi:predicted transcriptional regulator of viral defense system
MDWNEFLNTAVRLPVVDTEDFLVGVGDSLGLKVQISRWKKSGKIIQLKKGVYLLAEPYRKIEVCEPYIAAILKKPSYLSLEKAFEYHNLIPEAVSVYTSITTKRQARFVSKAGIFDYRHIKKGLFFGYKSVTVNRQTAFIALPEKALLDLFYFKKGEVTAGYIEELRLQNLENISLKRLFNYAKLFKKPKIFKAVDLLREHIRLYKKRVKDL